ncbi:MAG: HutP family protein [Veillonellaceae bacterium]|nr:HutP family protein [Veillonellaceae bacterium]
MHTSATNNTPSKSIEVGRYAMRLAMTASREEESTLRAELANHNVKTAAVDFGGIFIDILPRIVENAVVAAQRTGIVPDTHVGEGAVVGAVQAALEPIKMKAMGQNIGGKIGLARRGEHLVVAIYGTVGVIHFNEVVAGIAHRAVADES